ncbi:hypothetical protein FXW07_07180 [Methanosarcina sp. DH1]|uniref:hypothetical protein n=1 Tax=Methanosarcina sp. DH1 TaxID=2605695 RepID=UPI001E40B25D|nr:hypothetical protein [Methanosarcina sp. DH1]MCC4766402.1 hypothetical protein [Methanosarcina sp. DH1]
MVKRSFAGRGPTLDELLAARRKKEAAAQATRAANLTTLQTVVNTANAAAQEATKAAQQAAATTAATNTAAATKAAQAATTAATTAATNTAAATKAATAAAATAAAAKAAQTAQAAKVSSLPINTGRFARSASNMPKTGDKVVVNGRTYTYVTEDRSVKGTTIGESKAQEAAAAAAKAAASTPTLQTDVANTTIVGPGGENPLSSSTLKTTSTNNNLVGGTTSTDKSSSILGTSADKSSSILGTTSSGAKTTTPSGSTTTTPSGSTTTTPSGSTTTTPSGAKTTTSSDGAKTTASSGAKTTAASLPFSTGRFSRDASNSIVNTTDEYITVNGKKYLNNNYVAPVAAAASSSSYYDVDTALTDMYNQAVAAGATGLTKPSSYGSTITDQTQAQKIIDEYQTKLNAALPVTYDISSNLANVNDTLKEYNISIKAPDVTQYTSEASAQAALDSYVAQANAALDTWTKSQPVTVYDDLGREQSVTYSQYEQMSTWQSKAKSSGTYTVLPEEVANSNAAWWINSKGLYEWEPVTAGDKAQLALENKQRAQLHQAAKTTLTCGASPSAAYSKEWYSTGGNRSTAKIGSGDVKIAQIKASSSVNNAATAVSNTAQTNKATLVSSSKSPTSSSSSSSSSKSSEAEAYAASTQAKYQQALAELTASQTSIQEQIDKNKSVTESTPKIVSTVSAEQKAAELTGSSTKSDFVTGNSALAKYNRAVNAQNITEPDTLTTYIQGDKNKLVTYAAEKNNVEDLDEQWAKIEEANYNKNVLTVGEKASTVNPYQKAALETAKAEAAKQEQLRQKIIANPLLDASGAVINQITTSTGAAKTTISNTAKIITPVYASQESKAAALTAVKKDYDTLLGMGLTSSKNPNTGKTILAAQTVDPTTQYYTQNAKQTAANAFKAAAIRNPFSVMNSGEIDRSAGWSVLTNDPYADKVADALKEARAVNPNGSEEYFQGVANVARRNQMSTLEVIQEDRAQANAKISNVLAPVFTAAEGAKAKYDSLLGNTSITFSDKGKISITKAGKETATGATFNVKQMQDDTIKSNVVLSGLHQFAVEDYNELKTRPVDYAAELGVMYVGGTIAGVGVGGLKLLSKVGVNKIASKVTSGAAKKVITGVGKYGVDAALVGSLVGGNVYTANKFFTSKEYSALSAEGKETAKQDYVAGLFGTAKEFAVGGLGMSKGIKAFDSVASKAVKTSSGVTDLQSVVTQSAKKGVIDNRTPESIARAKKYSNNTELKGEITAKDNYSVIDSRTSESIARAKKYGNNTELKGEITAKDNYSVIDSRTSESIARAKKYGNNTELKGEIVAKDGYSVIDNHTPESIARAKKYGNNTELKGEIVAKDGYSVIDNRTPESMARAQKYDLTNMFTRNRKTDTTFGNRGYSYQEIAAMSDYRTGALTKAETRDILGNLGNREYDINNMMKATNKTPTPKDAELGKKSYSQQEATIVDEYRNGLASESEARTVLKEFGNSESDINNMLKAANKTPSTKPTPKDAELGKKSYSQQEATIVDEYRNGLMSESEARTALREFGNRESDINSMMKATNKTAQKMEDILGTSDKSVLRERTMKRDKATEAADRGRAILDRNRSASMGGGSEIQSGGQVLLMKTPKKRAKLVMLREIPETRTKLTPEVKTEVKLSKNEQYIADRVKSGKMSKNTASKILRDLGKTKEDIFRILDIKAKDKKTKVMEEVKTEVKTEVKKDAKKKLKYEDETTGMVNTRPVFPALFSRSYTPVDESTFDTSSMTLTNEQAKIAPSERQKSRMTSMVFPKTTATVMQRPDANEIIKKSTPVVIPNVVIPGTKQIITPKPETIQKPGIIPPNVKPKEFTITPPRIQPWETTIVSPIVTPTETVIVPPIETIDQKTITPPRQETTPVVVPRTIATTMFAPPSKPPQTTFFKKPKDKKRDAIETSRVKQNKVIATTKVASFAETMLGSTPRKTITSATKPSMISSSTRRQASIISQVIPSSKPAARPASKSASKPVKSQGPKSLAKPVSKLDQLISQKRRKPVL